MCCIFLIKILFFQATYPCGYCHVNGVQKFADPWEAELRTFGNLEENFQRFQESGADRSKAKKVFNVINKPLLKGDPTEYVLDKICIPELHLNLGNILL